MSTIITTKERFTTTAARQLPALHWLSPTCSASIRGSPSPVSDPANPEKKNNLVFKPA